MSCSTSMDQFAVMLRIASDCGLKLESVVCWAGAGPQPLSSNDRVALLPLWPRLGEDGDLWTPTLGADDPAVRIVYFFTGTLGCSWHGPRALRDRLRCMRLLGALWEMKSCPTTRGCRWPGPACQRAVSIRLACGTRRKRRCKS